MTGAARPCVHGDMMSLDLASMRTVTIKSVNEVPDCLVDVSRLIWRGWAGRLPTGIDRTCLAYIKHFHPYARAVMQWNGRTSVFNRKASQQIFTLLRSGGQDGRAALLRTIAANWAGSVWPCNLVGMPYFNVGHTGLDRPAHTAWIRHKAVRPIYFVHDLIPITHPEYCRPGEAEKHFRRMMALLTHGAGVISNSHHTLRELADFAASQPGLHMPPAVVAPLGVSKVEREAGRKSLHPGRPYFVMLGTIEGRKNHLMILNVWADLARRLGTACPQLVIIGQRGWECEQAVDMLERCKAIVRHVIELPRCDDGNLREYIAGAQALLFPSFVEGYGLPLVEALSLGTPAIASDLPVFRELAGAIPDYLSPLDGMGWGRLVENYTQPQSVMRSAQLQRMHDWQVPRWREHFAVVDHWFRQSDFTPSRLSRPND